MRPDASAPTDRDGRGRGNDGGHASRRGRAAPGAALARRGARAPGHEIKPRTRAGAAGEPPVRERECPADRLTPIRFAPPRRPDCTRRRTKECGSGCVTRDDASSSAYFVLGRAGLCGIFFGGFHGVLQIFADVDVLFLASISEVFEADKRARFGSVVHGFGPRRG